MSSGDHIHDRFFPLSRIKPDPATCHCGKVALYRVEDKGYCRAHKADAGQSMETYNAQLSERSAVKAEFKYSHLGQPTYSRNAERTEREKARRR
jgi:hypothetical protein